MRKKLILGLIALLMLGMLSGCSTKSAGGKKKIVTAIFPVYDWARNVTGENDNTELVLLVDNGVDLHSFQPTAEDIMNISTCDLFIYVGGESDKWVKDALKDPKNKERKVLCLMDELSDFGGHVLAEEEKEGMEEHEHDHEDGEEEEDEHIWLSLVNAKACCDEICDVLSESVDKGNAESYRKNTDAYKAKLSELDEEYKAVAEAGSTRTLVFADRFPFLYLVKDYGLDYFAAFSGCSAESEASFETVVFLANKLDELSLKCVVQIETGDKKFADKVIESSKNSDRKVLMLNSIQSVTQKDIKNGVNFLDIMKENLEVLKEALA